MKFAVAVPTLNPGLLWSQWLVAYASQEIKPFEAWIIDSGSLPASIERALDEDFRIVGIPRSEFNHGGTRQRLVDLLDPSIEVVVFLTQDAVLAGPKALSTLVSAFEDQNVAAAYGRQLPHSNAKPLGAHARHFNYGQDSSTQSLESLPVMGFKSCFLSNSFAAYRISDLRAVGGFPNDLILGEDAAVGARLIIAGKKIRYVAEACVFHSHDYSGFQEFRRYFDIGVFHTQVLWMLDKFGEATGEGWRFVRSEWRYLWVSAPYLIPVSLLRTGLKWLGYRLGKHHQVFPQNIRRLMSMHRQFWTMSD